MQVISGDESGTVCLWHVHTGAREGHFKRAHGDGRLTAMALDAQERRLLTGHFATAVPKTLVSCGLCS